MRSKSAPDADLAPLDPNAPALTRDEFEAQASFRYAMRRFLRGSERAAYAAGVTPQQYQALLMIKGYPDAEELTVGQLAERLQIEHHSTVELVDRMVEQELLVRRPDETDRRQVCVSLTDRGHQLVAQVAATNRQYLKRLGPELDRILRDLMQEN